MVVKGWVPDTHTWRHLDSFCVAISFCHCFVLPEILIFMFEDNISPEAKGLERPHLRILRVSEVQDSTFIYM